MLLKMPKDKIIDKLSKKEAKKNKDDEIEQNHLVDIGVVKYHITSRRGTKNGDMIALFF